MIDRGPALPLTVQARQLDISRGSIYYLPRGVSDADLAIMRRIDAYASAPEARASMGRYIAFYNAVRPHSALGGRTLDQIYFQ